MKRKYNWLNIAILVIVIIILLVVSGFWFNTDRDDERITRELVINRNIVTENTNAMNSKLDDIIELLRGEDLDGDGNIGGIPIEDTDGNMIFRRRFRRFGYLKDKCFKDNSCKYSKGYKKCRTHRKKYSSDCGSSSSSSSSSCDKSFSSSDCDLSCDKKNKKNKKCKKSTWSSCPDNSSDFKSCKSSKDSSKFTTKKICLLTDASSCDSSKNSC